VLLQYQITNPFFSFCDVALVPIIPERLSIDGNMFFENCQNGRNLKSGELSFEL
jgi:hypothetical protein